MKNTFDIELLTLRDTLPEDAFELKKLYYVTWLDTYPNIEQGITREDIEDSYKDSFSDEKISEYKEIIKNTTKNQKRLVAIYNDMIVGTISIETKDDHNRFKTIYILPEFQGKGIGTVLWNEVKKFIDTKKDTIVQCVTYNKKTIGFYKKLGFVDTGKRWSDEKWKMKSGNTLPEMELVIKAGGLCSV